MLVVFHLLEKPGRDARYQDEHEGGKQRERDAQPDPELDSDPAPVAPQYQGQHDQHGRIGDDGPAHRDRYARVLGHPEPARNRVGHQRMGGKDAGHEETRLHIEAEQVTTHGKADSKWNGKGEEGEQEAPVAVGLELDQVQLESRQEHDVQQADRGEHIHEQAFFQNVESVGTNDDASGDQPDDSRYAQALHQDRNQQDDEQDQREDQDRAAQRQLEGVQQQIDDRIHDGSVPLRDAISRADMLTHHRPHVQCHVPGYRRPSTLLACAAARRTLASGLRSRGGRTGPAPGNPMHRKTVLSDDGAPRLCGK